MIINKTLPHVCLAVGVAMAVLSAPSYGLNLPLDEEQTNLPTTIYQRNKDWATDHAANVFGHINVQNMPPRAAATLIIDYLVGVDPTFLDAAQATLLVTGLTRSGAQQLARQAGGRLPSTCKLSLIYSCDEGRGATRAINQQLRGMGLVKTLRLQPNDLAFLAYQFHMHPWNNLS